MKHVLVAGASGVVGLAALRHFAAEPGTAVTGIARRAPSGHPGGRFVSVDLTDRAACAAAFRAMRDVTHLVYAALYEQPGLAAGWVDGEQIATNTAMLANILEPLSAAAPLRHVTLLQGAKAYGAHLHPIPIPAREDRDERRDVPNFYWTQEDMLRATAAQYGWTWTILRPQIIFGDAIGAAMNPVPAIGAWAAVLKERGLPLAFPGGATSIAEATDADLLARAIGWAGESPAAAGEAFNVTNGDVFVWRNVWPVIADALGMPTALDAPCSLAAAMADQSPTWDRIRARAGLVAPALDAFVGQSLHYVDILTGFGRTGGKPPSAMSTIKLRQAGFHDVIDTETMLRKWFARLQEQRLLPPRG